MEYLRTGDYDIPSNNEYTPSSHPGTSSSSLVDEEDMIRQIYYARGTLTNPRSALTSNAVPVRFFALHAMMYATGEDLRIQGLKDTALAKFLDNTSIPPNITEAQRHFRPISKSQVFDFAIAIVTAFNSSTKSGSSLQDCLIKILGAQPGLLETQSIRAAIEAAPKLGIDLLMRLSRRILQHTKRQRKRTDYRVKRVLASAEMDHFRQNRNLQMGFDILDEVRRLSRMDF